MRLKLAGWNERAHETIVLKLNAGTFTPAEYTALGYTMFDVITIGAAGGDGGDAGIPNGLSPGWIAGGGGGGGGGVQMISGLLSSLTSSVAVTVGAAGVNGTDYASGATNPSPTTNGTDGGSSSFGSYCKASGGKGGQKGQIDNSSIWPLVGTGGNGGKGGVLTAGDGGAGGSFGYTIADFPAGDGLWTGSIGTGGGGGAGGWAKPDGEHFTVAKEGGRGAWNASEQSLYGPKGPPAWYPINLNTYLVVQGGGGGGAKAYPLNASQFAWGSAANSAAASRAGAVFIRLYSV